MVKGRATAVVKIGTKFAEVRDADGKMILRAAAGLARAEHAQRRGCDGRVGGWLGKPGRPRSSQSSSQQLVIAGEAGRGPVSDGLNRWHGQRRQRARMNGTSCLDRHQIRVAAITFSAAFMPAIIASAGRIRCSSNTPIRARVPGPSPSRLGRSARTVDGSSAWAC